MLHPLQRDLYLFSFIFSSMADISFSVPGAMEVIIGTYEQYLLGYCIKKHDDSYSFEPTFSCHAHTNSLKCVAANDKFLASGSIDETIQLFNMKTRRELGNLQQHNGTITALEFFDTFLFSSSEDSKVCVWSVKKWQCEKTLIGHKDSVTDISVHPSGKLCLSISKDKTLRTWNMIKGRLAYTTNIKKDADFVQWTPNGHFFLIGTGNTIEVYSIEAGGVVYTIKLPRRIHAVDFINDDICAIGDESGAVFFHDISKKVDISHFMAHSSRVKCLKCFKNDGQASKWLLTASSDGFLKLWELDVSKLSEKPALVCEVNTTCRPTCMTIINNVPSQSLED